MVGSLEKKRGDLLLKMVDDLEYNMKLSRSEIQRGRLYEKYAEKREAKLREEWATKGDQRRAKMKVIESQLEESLARMPARKQDSAIRQGHQVFDLLTVNLEMDLMLNMCMSCSRSILNPIF